MRSSHVSKEFLSGVRDELPILVGVIPFGMIYGILALGAGLSTGEAQAMSAIVFAGSAQFITVQLAGVGAPALFMILTGFVVNLRHALYSASVASYTRRLSLPWKALLAYLLTGEAYAVAITHYHRVSDDTHKHWYFLGAGLALSLGIVAGQHSSRGFPGGTGAARLVAGIHAGAGSLPWSSRR